VNKESRPVDPALPTWARRMRKEREARGWSQLDAVRAMRAHSSSVASEESLLRTWKRWEKAESHPDEHYRPLIAKTFGTVTAAIFPVVTEPRDAGILSATGMDTLEIVARLRTSDVNASTLEALSLTVERLCSEYPHMPPEQLLVEGRQWLRRMTQLLDKRLTLKQHREVLRLAGYLALLVGCVEYDLGQKGIAEGTRTAAMSLGNESESADVVGWAFEMQAWYALTQGDYRSVITASNAGQEAAPRQSVAVQLAAQKAKAWARLGDRRQVELALDEGRRLLEALPQPENLDNHFVVDPSKFDFYAMDCYRLVGEDRLAETYANEVLRNGTDFDGSERSPMRNAEARVTLGVVAARGGDAEAAIHQGQLALAGERKSLPSLLMTSRELAHVLNQRFDSEPSVVEYVDQLHQLRNTVK
jgi:transcriptional regulator with XRE-family HTH domain